MQLRYMSFNLFYNIPISKCMATISIIYGLKENNVGGKEIPNKYVAIKV